MEFTKVVRILILNLFLLGLLSISYTFMNLLLFLILIQAQIKEIQDDLFSEQNRLIIKLLEIIKN